MRGLREAAGLVSGWVREVVEVGGSDLARKIEPSVVNAVIPRQGVAHPVIAEGRMREPAPTGRAGVRFREPKLARERHVL